MAEVPANRMAPNYPGNTNKAKISADPGAKAPAERIKKEQVVTGEVVQRKKSLGKKIKESFTGDDARSVLFYLAVDVAVPAVKTLLGDLVNQGLSRAMWGDGAPNRISTGRGAGYNNMYRQLGSAQTAGRYDGGSPAARSMTPRGRAVHDFTEIVLPDRAQAEEVIERLHDIVNDYGFASVSDLYDLVGITGSYTDDKWGWADLRASGVSRVREGWLLNLPRAVPMD